MGRDAQSQPLYTARAQDVLNGRSGMFAGKIGSGLQGCQYSLNSKVMVHSPYQVLCYSAKVKPVLNGVAQLALE